MEEVSPAAGARVSFLAAKEGGLQRQLRSMGETLRPAVAFAGRLLPSLLEVP